MAAVVATSTPAHLPSYSPHLQESTPELHANNHAFIDTTIPHDGGLMHYGLEGNPSADSPTIVIINEATLNFHIWDRAVKLLKDQHPEYRFLRYDIRGYSMDSIGNSKEITLSLLANDLCVLLSHLHISNVHSLIGLGLGASIALTYLGQAEQRPAKVSTFVGISFPLPGSPFFTEPVTKERLSARTALAARWKMGIIADKTVANWFTVDARGTPDWVYVKEMVEAGSAEGMGKVFDAVVESISPSFGGREVLGDLNIPSLFLTGAGDSVFPEEMEDYSSLMKDGLSKFVVVDRASRLLFFERAKEFVDILEAWLDSSFNVTP